MLKIFLLLIMITGQVVAILPAANITANNNEKSVSQIADIDDIDPLIDDIYSCNQEERSAAKQKLLKIAAQSDELRAAVIAALARILEDGKLFSQEGINPRAGTWADSADLLGELKAVEAVAILVKRLDYNAGKNGADDYPAINALIKIGADTIPSLTAALLAARSPIVRANAAKALGQLGGADAHAALERALLTETDDKVINSIWLSNLSPQ
jgi:HEAT repeat protein